MLDCWRVYPPLLNGSTCFNHRVWYIKIYFDPTFGVDQFPIYSWVKVCDFNHHFDGRILTESPWMPQVPRCWSPPVGAEIPDGDVTFATSFDGVFSKLPWRSMKVLSLKDVEFLMVRDFRWGSMGLMDSIPGSNGSQWVKIIELALEFQQDLEMKNDFDRLKFGLWSGTWIGIWYVQSHWLDFKVGLNWGWTLGLNFNMWMD